MNDSMISLFLSGRGHVYYALIVSMGVLGAVLLGWIRSIWIAAALALDAGVFADLWAHGYAH
jgi:hypothetical protein